MVRPMRFTLRQLEYFIAVGETGSLTVASERIHMSPPALSTAISHLETELKARLFIRHHAQGLSLTPAGRTLLGEAKRVVAQAEGLYTVASQTSLSVRGSLSVGCMVTLAPMLVPELTRSFTAAFPAAQVSHVEGHGEDLLRSLRRCETDIALIYDLRVTDDIEFHALVSLPPYVVVAETHRLAGRPAVTFGELSEEPMVLLDLPLSREYFLALFMKEGLEPRIAARSPHQEVVRSMVASGYGYTLFNARPKSDRALDGRRLSSVRIAGEHQPMTIGVATLRELTRSRLIDAFHAHCKESISRSSIPGMIAPVFTERLRVG